MWTSQVVSRSWLTYKRLTLPWGPFCRYKSTRPTSDVFPWTELSTLPDFRSGTRRVVPNTDVLMSTGLPGRKRFSVSRDEPDRAESRILMDLIRVSLRLKISPESWSGLGARGSNSDNFKSDSKPEEPSSRFQRWKKKTVSRRKKKSHFKKRKNRRTRVELE